MKPIVTAAFLPLIALAMAAPVLAARPAYGGGEVLWDSFGVPHIYAKTEAGGFYGFGWAQAQSHGNLLLKIYGESRARSAEYWGPEGEKSDRWLIANDVPARSVRWYKSQTPSMRKNLDAFAAGVNAYAAAHPDAIAPEMRRVLPLSGVDVIMHAHRLMNYYYIASESRVMAGVTPAGEGEPAVAPEGSDGSNAWAVMPRRTAAGKTLLLSNPHLPWAPSMLTYYEAQITTPTYSVYGGTQVGLPVVRFAFNDNLGFTNTVNTILGFTNYRLTLEDGGYRFDGKVKRFTTTPHSYKVRQPDGSLKTVRFVQRATVQGPVFDVPEKAGGGAIALRVAGLDRPGALQQYLDMGKAQNFAGFEAAVRKLQVPTFNIIYADRDGHVLYLDNGILPKHKTGGNYKLWNAPVAGDTSETLWTETHSYDELPKVFDPPGGFVQNANDPPWVSTWPRVLNPAEWPAHVAEVGPMSMRAQMSTKLIAGDDKISWDDFVTRKLSTTSLMAERMIPPLLDAVGKTTDPDLARAQVLLAGWDRRYESNSDAALLFETWAKLFAGPTLVGSSNFAEPWKLEDALETPRGLKDPAKAVAMLKKAVEQARQQFGSVDRPFGEVSRLRVADANLPGHGGLGNLGIFRVMTWSPLKDGTRQAVHGETWVSMVEFGTPMKAIGLMSYGNSSQPGSPHRTDQLPMVMNKQFRTLWRDRVDVEKHLEERVEF